MATQPLNYMDTGSAVTIIADGKAHNISNSHANYKPIMDALLAQDWDKAKKLADIATAIKTYVSSASADVEVKAGGVYYKGEKLGGAVVDTILRFLEENKPTDPLIKFVERLMANPSFKTRQKLYGFLEGQRLPITADGKFLSYKAVKADYKSKTAGRETVQVSTDGGKTWVDEVGHISNPVGAILKVDRSKVDDESDHHCSYGLHAGSVSYVTSFKDDYSGDRMIIVEIDPADVVAVPTDGHKLRTCQYRVVSDFAGEMTSALADADNPYADYDNDDENPDYDYDEDYEDNDEGIL